MLCCAPNAFDTAAQSAIEIMRCRHVCFFLGGWNQEDGLPFDDAVGSAIVRASIAAHAYVSGNWRPHEVLHEAPRGEVCGCVCPTLQRSNALEAFSFLLATQVLVGVLQRFGVVALAKEERQGMLSTCIHDRPHVLEICVARLTEMQVRRKHMLVVGRCSRTRIDVSKFWCQGGMFSCRCASKCPSRFNSSSTSPTAVTLEFRRRSRKATVNKQNVRGTPLLLR